MLNISEAIIPKDRRFTKKGNLKIVSAWRVQKSKNYPEGLRYSFIAEDINIYTK